MRTIILTGLSFVLHLFAGPAASAAINGADDFNDNLKDEEKWSPDRTLGGGVLNEAGQHLEYTSSGTSFTQYAYRPWKLNKATYDTNWEVIVDLANTAAPTVADTSASIGIEVFAAFSSFTKSAFFELYASKNGNSPLERGFQSALVNDENFSGVTTSETTATSGSVRITFNAVSKVLTLYRDANGPVGGYSWTQQAAYGIAGSGGTNANGSWGLTGSDELIINVYGYSELFATPAGAMFADNFSAFSGTSITTSAATNVGSGSATLNATVFPSGADTNVVFEYSTDEDFLETETTTPQIIPGTATSTVVSTQILDLTAGMTYWVRAKATNTAGTFTGNTVIFSLPPYTLTINPSVGSVNSAPFSPTYDAGATVTLTANPPVGSTFFSWTGDVTGNQNPITVVMNGNKNVTANFTLPIAQAADSNLTFTTGGAKPWFGQTAISRDGSDSAMSGPILDNEVTWFQSSVNGPGQISFWLKLSSESGDVFEFFIDGIRQPDYTGGEIDWHQKTYNLTAGSHTLRWQYRKDIILFGGSDAVWVDEITFVPALDFNAWRATKFTAGELGLPSISGTNADPDADGINNLLEFALGGQPKDGVSDILPDCKVETIGGENYLTLTLKKPAGVMGVTYTPQVSGELGTWHGGSPHVFTIINNATTLRVRDSTPMSAEGNRFIRLMVGAN